MKIELPHLGYTVLIKPRKYHKKSPEWMVACTERTDEHTSTIFMDPPYEPGDLAHEITHVLQYLCGDRGIDFVREEEHMAYIMHYLMGRIRKRPYRHA